MCTCVMYVDLAQGMSKTLDLFDSILPVDLISWYNNYVHVYMYMYMHYMYMYVHVDISSYNALCMYSVKEL